jgi:hypothetical protein
MSKRAFWAVAIVGCLALCVWLASASLERSARRAATENGLIRDFHQVTAEELDRDVRNKVSVGTTLAAAEEYPKSEGMQFSYDPSSQSIQARAPYLKGSNFWVVETLGFKFQFDNLSKLKSINSSVHRTGP